MSDQPHTCQIRPLSREELMEIVIGLKLRAIQLEDTCNYEQAAKWRALANELFHSDFTYHEDTPMPKLTFEQLKTMMKPYLRYVDQIIVHKATSTKYRVEHFEFIESTMALHFSYYPLSDPIIVFSRPVTELTHERYEFPDERWLAKTKE
jgi:hypothetical protein